MWAFDLEKGLTRGDAIGLLSALLLVGLTSLQFGKSYLLIPVNFESELQYSVSSGCVQTYNSCFEGG